MTTNTICYKLKNPKVYNEGTVWEKTEDEFLLCYASDDATEELAKLNGILASGNYPEGRFRGSLLDWENIAYFFDHRQPTFDTLYE